MNEEIIQQIYRDLGLEQGGVDYDQFKSKFTSDDAVRKQVFTDLGLEQGGVSYDQFEAKIGLKKKDSTDLGSLLEADSTATTGDGSGEQQPQFQPDVATQDTTAPQQDIAAKKEVAGREIPESQDFVTRIQNAWKEGRLNRKLADDVDRLVVNETNEIIGEDGQTIGRVDESLSVREQFKLIDREVGEFKNMQTRELTESERDVLNEDIQNTLAALSSIPKSEVRTALDNIQDDDDALINVAMLAASNPSLIPEIMTSSIASDPKAILITSLGALGGPLGLVASQAVATYSSEEAMGMLTALERNGIDVSDKQQLLSLATNPELVEKIKSDKSIRSATMAGIEGIVAGLTLGVSRFGRPGQIAGGILEVSSGGLSEAGGQVAETGEGGGIALTGDVNMAEVGIEAIADLGSNVPSAISATTQQSANIYKKARQGARKMPSEQEIALGKTPVKEVDEIIDQGDVETLQQLVTDGRVDIENLPVNLKNKLQTKTETLDDGRTITYPTRILGDRRPEQSETGGQVDGETKPDAEQAREQAGADTREGSDQAEQEVREEEDGTRLQDDEESGGATDQIRESDQQTPAGDVDPTTAEQIVGPKITRDEPGTTTDETVQSSSINEEQDGKKEERSMLEDPQDGGLQEEGRQEGAELRAEEAQEDEITTDEEGNITLRKRLADANRPQQEQASTSPYTVYEETTGNMMESLEDAKKTGTKKTTFNDLKNNAKFIRDELFSKLKEEKVKDLSVNRAKQAVNKIIKGVKKNITESDIDAIHQTVASIVREDRIKKATAAMASAKKNLSKGKLAEYTKTFRRLIDPDVVNLSAMTEDVFNNYVETVTDIASKLERGQIMGSEVNAIKQLEQAVFAGLEDKQSIEYFADRYASIYDGADLTKEEFVGKLSEQKFESLTKEEVEFLDKNFNEIKEQAINNTPTVKPPENSAIPAGMAVPYYKLAGKAFNEFDGDPNELSDFVTEYVKENHKKEFGDKAIDEGLIDEAAEEFANKASVYGTRSNRIDSAVSKSEDLLSFTKRFSDPKEKQYIRTLASIDESLLSNFDNYELSLLNRVIDSIKSGFMPPITTTMYRKINGLIEAKPLAEGVTNEDWKKVTDDMGNFIPFFERDIRETLRKQGKNTLSAKVIQDMAMTETGANLSFLGKQVDKVFSKFYTLFGRHYEVYKSNVDNVNEGLRKRWDKIKRNTTVDGVKYSRDDINYLANMYLMELQFLTNKKSKKVPRLKEIVDGFREATSDDQKMAVVKMYDRFKHEGESPYINLEEVKKVLKKAGAMNEKTNLKETALLDFIQAKFRETQEMSYFNSKYVLKNDAELFNNYVTIRPNRDTGKAVSPEAFDFMRFIDPSLSKAGTSRVRGDYMNADGTYKSADISFDLFDNARYGIIDQYKGYYLSEGFRDAYAVLTTLKASLNNQGKNIVEGLQNAIQQKMRYEMDYSTAMDSKWYETISSNLKSAILASPIRRLLPELFSNAIMAMTNPDTVKRAAEGNTISMKEAKAIAEKFGSEQIARIRGENDLGQYTAENTQWGKQLRDAGIIDTILDMLTLQGRIRKAAGTIIAAPDKRVSVTMWRAKFKQALEEQGVEYTPDLAFNEDLQDQFAREIDLAIRSADQLVTSKWSGSSFFMTTNKSKNKNRLLRDITNYFIGFRMVQAGLNADARASIFSLAQNEYYKKGGRGSMSKKEAIANLALNTIANTSYTVMTTAMTHLFLDRLFDWIIGDDDETKDLSQRFNEAGERGLIDSFLLLTPLGRSSSIAFSVASFLIQKGLDEVQGDEKPTNIFEYFRFFGLPGSIAMTGFSLANSKDFPALAENSAKALWQLSGIPGFLEFNEMMKRSRFDSENDAKVPAGGFAPEFDFDEGFKFDDEFAEEEFD